MGESRKRWKMNERLAKIGNEKTPPKTKQLTDTRQKSLKILKDFQFTENWKNVQNNKAGENMSKIAGSWEKKNGTKICRNKDKSAKKQDKS